MTVFSRLAAGQFLGRVEDIPDAALDAALVLESRALQ